MVDWWRQSSFSTRRLLFIVSSVLVITLFPLEQVRILKHNNPHSRTSVTTVPINAVVVDDSTSMYEHVPSRHEEPPVIIATEIEREVFNVTKNRRAAPTLYFCENAKRNEVGAMLDLMASILPEYARSNLSMKKQRRGWNSSASGNEYDVFLLSIGGSCQMDVANWMLHHYRGNVLLWSPESKAGPRNFSDKMYVLGPVYESDSGESGWHEMRLYHLQIIFWSLFYKNAKDHRFHYNRSGEFLFDTEKKPKNTGKEFLVYSHSNCKPHRDDAFVKISEIGVVHSAGRCGEAGTNRVKVASNVSLKNWGDNALINRDYRFCLTMEHGLQEGYITEKILLAFFAGCIPIYWGPTSIFDMFSPDSFIYYNVSNPQPALDRIRFLESNKTAYFEMLNSTSILRNGTATIEKYFSFSDEIGAGKLKKRIRTFLELDRA